MPAIIKPWSEAPVDATHQHTATGAWYKVEGDKVRVFGGNKKWNNSKVVATSAMLQPRPVNKEPEEMKPEVKVIEVDASSKEAFIKSLQDAGLPAELIDQMVAEIEGTDLEEDEACDCEVCSMSRHDEGLVVAKKLVELLNGIKEHLELDFEVEEVMNLMGFVKSNATTGAEREAEIAIEKQLERLEPVAKQLVEETGMPPQIAVAGMMQVYRALDAHGLIAK